MTATSPHKRGLSLPPAQALQLLRECNWHQQFVGEAESNTDPAPLTVDRVEEVVGGFNNSFFKVFVSITAENQNQDQQENNIDNNNKTSVVVGVRLSNLSSWPLFKLEGEVASLKLMRKYLCSGGEEEEKKTHVIPKVYGLRCLSGELFSGVAAIVMDFIPGTPLTQELFSSLTAELQDDLLRQLAALLRQMQGVTRLDAVRFVAATDNQNVPGSTIISNSSSSSSFLPIGRIAAFEETAAGDIVTVAPFFDIGGQSSSTLDQGPFADLVAFYAQLLRLRVTQVEDFLSSSPSAATNNLSDACRAHLEETRSLLRLLADVLQSERAEAALRASPLAITHLDFAGRNLLVSVVRGGGGDERDGEMNSVSSSSSSSSSSVKVTGFLDWEWTQIFDAGLDWAEALDDLDEDVRARFGALQHDQNTQQQQQQQQDAGGGATAAVAVAATTASDQQQASLARWLWKIFDEIVPWHVSAFFSEPEKFPLTNDELAEHLAAANATCAEMLRSIP